MSEELLSAMLDGECTAAEVRQLLDAMEQSPKLKARWSRMVLARDAVSNTRITAAAPDFASSVMAAIEADDTESVVASPKVVPIRRAAPAPAVVVSAPGRVAARRWQPLAGLAAAASITAAVVVAGGSLLSHPVGVSPQTASRSSNVGQPGTLNPLATTLAENSVTETRWSSIDSAAARQLNDYLMEHSNSRSEAGMGGSLSYARLAVRTADYRPAAEQR